MFVLPLQGFPVRMNSVYDRKSDSFSVTYCIKGLSYRHAVLLMESFYCFFNGVASRLYMELLSEEALQQDGFLEGALAGAPRGGA